MYKVCANVRYLKEEYYLIAWKDNIKITASHVLNNTYTRPQNISMS
jgi:hypothetical protein